MNFLSKIFGVDDGVAADNRATEKLAALNRDAYERGVLSYDDFNLAQQRLYASKLDANAAESELYGGFAEGLKEGADNIRRTGDDVIGTTLATILRAVPIWVWIGGAIFILWQLGLNLKTLRIKP